MSRPSSHAFEEQPGTDECAFCGLAHPDYGDDSTILPDPPGPPDDLLDNLPRLPRRYGHREAS